LKLTKKSTIIAYKTFHFFTGYYSF